MVEPVVGINVRRGLIRNSTVKSPEESLHSGWAKTKIPFKTYGGISRQYLFSPNEHKFRFEPHGEVR